MSLPSPPSACAALAVDPVHLRSRLPTCICLWSRYNAWERFCCRLEDIGAEVGLRLLEILCFREKNSKRDIRLLDVLKFVHTSLWKYLFGRQAKDLEQSNTVGIHCVSP